MRTSSTTGTGDAAQQPTAVVGPLRPSFWRRSSDRTAVALYPADRLFACTAFAACVLAALACAAPYGRTSDGDEPATGAAGAGSATPDGPAADRADAATAELDGDYVPAEIATLGWDRISGGPIVLVRDLRSGRVVPIWIGVPEARAIASALAEVEMPRPMTHDLMADLLGRLDASFEELLIHDLVDNTFFALLKLRPAGGGELLVDARPSDGLALALRTGARIRIARRIVEESPDFEFMAPEGESQVVRALGLTLVAPSDELRERFGLPERDGLVVTRAVGEAERRGLQRGDLVLTVDGRAMGEPVDFLDALREAPFDRRLEIVYWRDGEERTAELDPTADEDEEPARTV